MSRTSSPDAKAIEKLAKRKSEDFNSQLNDLDNKAIEQYLQTDRKSLYQPEGQGEAALRPVGSGMMGFMDDQDVSVLHTKPLARVEPLGDRDARQHASGKLEPWLNSAIWIGAGGYRVWDKGVLALVNVGRFWSKVLPAPQITIGDDLGKMIAELNQLMEQEASEEEIRRVKDKISDYKANPANFPIRWLYVATATWPVYDERPGHSEVVEKRKISCDVVEEKLGRLPDEYKDKKNIEVIEYANDIWVATVLPHGGDRESGFLIPPWEHGLGVNPYVLIEGNPLPDNDEGWEWRGGAFHMRHLLPAVDEVLSDFSTNIHNETVTPPYVVVNLEQRAAHGIEDKTIEVSPNKTVKMYTGQGWREEAGRFPTATLNPDALKFVTLAQELAYIGGLNRPALAGIAPSGQAGVTLETARQIATGEMKIPHSSLEEGFAQIGSRFLRAVKSLAERYPDILGEITVRAEDKEHKSKPISIGPKDVRGWEYNVRGRVTLNIPINEGANVTNASIAGNPDHPFLSDDSIRERYFRHEDPVEEGDRIFAQQLMEELRAILRGLFQRRLGAAVEGMGGGDIEGMIEGAGGMVQAPLEALLSSYGEAPPQGLVERARRGQMNTSRAGRGQRPSQLGSMNMETPSG